MTLALEPRIAAEDRLVAAHERTNLALADLCDLIVDFERREAYRVDGARNMPDWLGYRLGYSERTAREYCRIATALQYLPAIDDAFRAGLLTIDKVRWLTEFCTPDEDPLWANDAVGLSPTEVRGFAVHRRRLAREAADARFKRRYLKIVPDVEEGIVRLWGRLSDVEGMAVKRTIDRLADRQPHDPETGGLVAYEQRCADALVQACSIAAASDSAPDRASIVCHADAETFASEDGVASIEGGMPIAAETLRRLACDARVQVMAHGRDGHPIGVGKLTRVVPPYLRRQLLKRDGGCAWPGCTNRNWTHAHHVIHVAHGGPTNEDNLVTLCPPHHRHVHEGGWSMRGRPGRDLRILRPDGSELDFGTDASRIGSGATGARGP